MAIKTAIVTIEDANRDFGKMFKITELPAPQAEKWAMRAVLALMRGGMTLPDGYEYNGMTALLGIAVRDMLPNLKWDDAEPLLDEMMTCVQVIPDPSKPIVVRPIMGDIEEVSTLFKLRLEVWNLHTDFLSAGQAPS